MSPETTKCILCKQTEPWTGCRFAKQLNKLENQSTKAKVPALLALKVLARSFQGLPEDSNNDTPIQAERRKTYLEHASIHKKAIRKINVIINSHLKSINPNCKRGQVQVSEN